MIYAYIQNNKVSWVAHQPVVPTPEGFTVVEVPDDSIASELYVLQGEVLRYTPEQLEAKSQVPPYAAKWNDETMTWVDQRTLSDAKIRKNQNINQWWMEANMTFFTFQDKEFSTDPLSRGNIDGINGYVATMNMFPEDWSGVWKANDNTLIEMSDIEVWKQFYAAMVAQGNANFLHAQQLKTQLNAAQTIPEVESIMW